MGNDQKYISDEFWLVICVAEKGKEKKCVMPDGCCLVTVNLQKTNVEKSSNLPVIVLREKIQVANLLYINVIQDVCISLMFLLKQLKPILWLLGTIYDIQGTRV